MSKSKLEKFLNKNKLSVYNNNEGFTFIEVVMSILIIGVVAVYLATAIPTSLLVTKQTQDITKANDLAQRYIENVKQELEDVTAYDLVTAGSEEPIEVTDDITNNGYFNISTDVEYLANETTGNVTTQTLKRIQVTFEREGYNSPLAQLSTDIARPRD